MTDGETDTATEADVSNESISRGGSAENFSVLVQAIEVSEPGALFKTRLRIGETFAKVLVRVLKEQRVYVEVSADGHLHGDIYHTDQSLRSLMASVVGDATDAWYYDNFDARHIPEHELEN